MCLCVILNALKRKDFTKNGECDMETFSYKAVDASGKDVKGVNADIMKDTGRERIIWGLGLERLPYWERNVFPILPICRNI